jgi:hypothetical protein
MLRLAWFAFVFITFSHAAAGVADCGYERVSVTGSDEEIADACRALEEVHAYFSDLGLAFEPQFSLTFHDRIFLDLVEPGAQERLGKVQVSGMYDAGRKEIHVTSGESELHETRSPWGIAWDPEIAYSILQHEMVHMAVHKILGSAYRELGPSWREFIAYSVQFELMKPDLRRHILASYPDIVPFRGPGGVSPLAHALDPCAFGVRAYLYTQENGGGEFIRRVLTGDIAFSTEEEAERLLVPCL